MLPEYDFSKGVRGKYYERFRLNTNVVVLDPDVAKAFPNSEAVNGALRVLAAAARRAVPRRSTTRPSKRSAPSTRTRRRR
jgi:hypothetical protein